MDEKHECAVCGKTYVRHASYREHIQSAHQSEQSLD